MKCYGKTSMPQQTEDFLDASAQDHDCIRDTLWWVHSDKSNLAAWKYDDNPFTSMGSNGIHPSCYLLQEEDAVSLSATGKSPSVYRFIQNLTVSTPATEGGVILSEKLAPLFRSIRLHDFFQSGSVSSSMLLAAELWVPDAPDDIKADVMQAFRVKKDMITKFLDPRFTGFFDRVKKNYPCITVQQASSHFRQCPPKPDTPQRLTREQCETMFSQAVQAVRQYARRIESSPVAFPSTRLE